MTTTTENTRENIAPSLILNSGSKRRPRNVPPAWIIDQIRERERPTAPVQVPLYDIDPRMPNPGYDRRVPDREEERDEDEPAGYTINFAM